MAYIGREPQIGNFQVCDAISTVNNQAAYTMQVGSVNVSPESANHMIVSLNGVIQKPTDAFTVSGSTITFAANLVTGDVINFIQILGNVLDLGVPSDATVSTAKIVDNAVTLAKMASGTDGNIISYDTSGNPVAVATGSSGQVLTSAGAGAVPSFQAAAGGGVVLQVVTDTLTSEYTTGSTSFNDTGLTLNITPAASSSKILIIAHLGGIYSNTSGNKMIFTCLRGSTNIGHSSKGFGFTAGFSDGRILSGDGFTFLDSPSTENQITYKVQARLENATGAGQISQEAATATLTCIEIGA